MGGVWKRTAGRTEGEYGLREDLSVLSEREMDMDASQPRGLQETVCICVCVYSILSRSWCGDV